MSGVVTGAYPTGATVINSLVKVYMFHFPVLDVLLCF